MSTRVQGLSGYVWITCACGKEVQRNADVFSVREGHVTDGSLCCVECRNNGRRVFPPPCRELVWDPDRKPQAGWAACKQDVAHTGRCTP